MIKSIQIVNIEKLEGLGVEEIDARILYEKGLIRSPLKPVKILGNGNFNSIIQISATEFSKSAEEKIEKLGGTVIKQ